MMKERKGSEKEESFVVGVVKYISVLIRRHRAK
jgi:hypothetical protein